MYGKLIKNLVLFVVGFSFYITLEVLFRGYSYALMGVVGGISLVVIDKINNRLSWETDLFVQGIIGALVITLFEFVIGQVFLHTSCLPVMWSYAGLPFNYNGVICLRFSILWFFLSIVAVFLADAINYYVFDEMPIPYYCLFGKFLFQFKAKRKICR